MGDILMGVIITGVNESLDIISRIELKHRNHQDDCKWSSRIFQPKVQNRSKVV